MGPSALRNRALALEGIPARSAEDQLDFGLELDGDLDTAIRDGSFGSAVRSILVAYDTSAQGGLQNVHVGDATLDSTGLVNWHYSEKLPLHLLDGPGAALAGLGGTLTTHFDDAPLPINELTLRRSSELQETEDIGDQRSNGRLDERT